MKKASRHWLCVVAAAFAAEGYKVLSKIKIGGTGGWDYVAVDSTNRRLYVSHGTHRGSGGSRRRQGGRHRSRNCTACTASPSRRNSARDSSPTANPTASRCSI